MKTRILHTKIYSDSYFVELNPSEKLLFIYYLTNENVNIIGCYECPDRKTSFDTGIDTPKIRVFQEKMEGVGKMFFKDGYVFLKNFTKYENYTGELNEKAKVKLLEQLSIPVREWYEGGMKGVYIPTINHKSEIINNKSKIINHKEGGSRGKQLLDDPEFIEGLKAKFPNHDVDIEIEKMKDWLLSNGKNKEDYAAFARNWLRKADPVRGGVFVIRE